MHPGQRTPQPHRSEPNAWVLNPDCHSWKARFKGPRTAAILPKIYRTPSGTNPELHTREKEHLFDYHHTTSIIFGISGKIIHDLHLRHHSSVNILLFRTVRDQWWDPCLQEHRRVDLLSLCRCFHYIPVPEKWALHRQLGLLQLTCYFQISGNQVVQLLNSARCMAGERWNPQRNHCRSLTGTPEEPRDLHPETLKPN